MIKLFRKIRQKLLTDNKFSKYLLYAFGEIVLVVIGILIALSINNWNENRKNGILEHKVLSEIESSLVENIAQLEWAKRATLEMNQSSAIVLDLWTKKLPYTDSLSWHLFKSTWYASGYTNGLSTSGYENLQNIGFSIVSNDSLRKEIIELFEKVIPGVLSKNSDNGEYVLYKEYYLRNFISRLGNEDVGYVPVDYDRLLNDTYYYSIIKDLQDRRTRKVGNFSWSIKKMNEVLQSLRNEIK